MTLLCREIFRINALPSTSLPGGIIFKISDGWVCTVCGYKSSRYKALRHYEAKHTLTAGYSCGFCQKVFKVEESRQRHMRQAHKLKISTKEIREMHGETSNL